MSTSTEEITNTQATELSPRPWHISESKVPGYSRIISIVDANDTVVCDMVGAGSSNERVLATVRANAKAIVEIMNNETSNRD